jgi:hypothetical protein
MIRTAVTDPAALRRLRDMSIGPVRAHDADHGSELLAHRHTVDYRLERLGLAVKAQAVLDVMDRTTA